VPGYQLREDLLILESRDPRDGVEPVCKREQEYVDTERRNVYVIASIEELD
jgi:hypothetical protein